MNMKNNLVRGTFILTFAGLLSRLIGFFYRIFLSRAIGAEGVGLYQLVFPLYILACSITVSGIQSAISRMVAARSAMSSQRSACRVLWIGLGLSVLLSIPVSAFFFFCCSPLSVHFLKNAQTASLLKIMAFAIPFGSVHACIDGYYFGVRNTSVPAARQLLEQMFRILLLTLFCQGIFFHEVSPSLAVLILVMEEIFSACFSFCVLLFHQLHTGFFSRLPHHFTSAATLRSDLLEMMSVAIPLSGNRALVCVLQSAEAGLLPLCLQRFGYAAGESLRIYGILSGMALPMILFPTAVTASLSTMILPSISAASALESHSRIHTLIRKSTFCCLGIGILFSAFFLLLGRPLTAFLFQNSLAGYYVQAFAFICPMLYLNPVLFSILNGLGKSSTVFFYNLTGMLVRLIFVLFIVPRLGISGYFAGLFVSQLLCNLLCGKELRKIQTVSGIKN